VQVAQGRTLTASLTSKATSTGGSTRLNLVLLSLASMVTMKGSTFPGFADPPAVCCARACGYRRHTEKMRNVLLPGTVDMEERRCDNRSLRNSRVAPML
jgi:hypothetical protein